VTTPFDSEYKATKRIKQGKAHLAAPFGELASWISSTWHVTVLNAIYDERDSQCAPRLQIILERQSDAARFHDGLNFDEEMQRAVKSKFLEIIGRDNVARFDVDGLFVVFSAFAPLALEEADSKIPDKELKALKVRIGNPDLWEISRSFGNVTFFFFTDAQAKHYEAEGKRTEYARMYFDLLKLHDEFGYLEGNEYTIAFDSKQNFDENYHSNWFYYYR
jgi:hypothetical protein